MVAPVSGYVNAYGIHSAKETRPNYENYKQNATNTSPAKEDAVTISDQARRMLADSLREAGGSDAQSESKASSDIWNYVASRYNPRNMTMDEMREMCQTLYDAGEISLQELGRMTIDYSRIPGATKYRELGQGLPIDWIAEFEDRLALQKAYGTKEGVNNFEKVLGYLNKIESNSNG